MISDLTPRQRSVLDFVIAFQRQHRMAPTVREIGVHLGLRGPAGILHILNVLRDEGDILAEPGKKRAWRFNRENGYSNMSPGIPLIGSIAAGSPIEAVENWERELAVSPELFGCNRCFGLRVRGDSVIEAHIMDGDLAIIRPQPRIEKGEIAAVLVQDQLPQATLKIVRWTRSSLFLEPANAALCTFGVQGPPAPAGLHSGQVYGDTAQGLG
jgi:repressor LexA